MNNIKILVCMLMFIISYQSKAQTVGYTYKAEHIYHLPW